MATWALQTVDGTKAAAQADVADGGYFTDGDIARAEQKGRAVVVNAPEAYAGNGARFDRTNSTYNPERDESVCPTGERLAYWRDKASKDPTQAEAHGLLPGRPPSGTAGIHRERRTAWSTFIQ